MEIEMNGVMMEGEFDGVSMQMIAIRLNGTDFRCMSFMGRWILPRTISTETGL